MRSKILLGATASMLVCTLLAIFQGSGVKAQLPSTQVATSKEQLEGRIAFVSNRDGSKQIYTMNSDGSQQLRLTDDPQGNEAPDFSIDGSKIVFESNRGYHTEIYTMNTDGSEQVRLTQDAGGVVGNVAPTFSFDGKRIAYASNRDGNWEIYSMNSDGSGRIRLTNHTADEDSPAFSRDGSHILFTSSRDSKPGEYHMEIYIMKSDGKDVKHLHTGDHAVFSPQGDILFDMDTPDGHAIYTMKADGSSVRRLSPLNTVEADAKFSYDGQHIVFDVSEGIQSWHRNAKIYIMNSDGTGRHLISQVTQSNYSPSWAIKTTSKIKGSELLSMIETPNLRLNLVSNANIKQKLESNNDEKIAGRLVYSYIDKDSDAVNLVSGREGGDVSQDFSVYNIEGLTSHSMARIKLSPNGRYALVKIERPQIGLWSIHFFYVWDLQQELKPVTLKLVAANLTQSSFISWSPDGEYLLFFSYRPFTPTTRFLTLYRWRTGEQTEVHKDTEGTLQPFFDWVAPHSTLYSSLAQVKLPAEVGEQDSTMRPNIYSASPEKGGATLVVQDGQRPTASPDGQWIAFFGSADPKKPFPLNSDWQYRATGVELSVARRDGTQRKALRSIEGNYPSLIWEADNRHLLVLQAGQVGPKVTTQVQECDTTTNIWRSVAKLPSDEVTTLGLSQDGKSLYLDVKTTGEDVPGQNSAEFHTLQAVELRTGQLHTIARLQGIIGFDWKERPLSAPRSVLSVTNAP